MFFLALLEDLEAIFGIASAPSLYTLTMLHHDTSVLRIHIHHTERLSTTKTFTGAAISSTLKFNGSYN